MRELSASTSRRRVFAMGCMTLLDHHGHIVDQEGSDGVAASGRRARSVQHRTRDEIRDARLTPEISRDTRKDTQANV